MEKKSHYSGPRVAIVGNVDSGKSTLVGVLTKGIPDDGRGAARSKVFNYAHEAQTGRTSSIAHEIMGFDSKGVQVFPERFIQNKNKYWTEVMQKCSKTISLIDLCGHEKYLKTTLLGLMGVPPDYVIVVVGANMGVSKMTKEHLGIVSSLNIPLIIVLTKVDMIMAETKQKTIDDIRKVFQILKKKILIMGCEEKDDPQASYLDKKQLTPKEMESIDSAVDLIAADIVCPLFQVSSVTSFGVLNLVTFLNKLKTRIPRNAAAPAEFDIHENLNPVGVGVVVSGVMISGTVKLNSVLCLGPDKDNTFKQVVVKSIHFNRIPVEEVSAGQFACFGIKPAKKSKDFEKRDFRKGVVLLDPALNPRGYYGFEANVSVLHHSTNIQNFYECVMHTGVVRQTVKIIWMEKSILRTGNTANVLFKFSFSPEYIKEGTTFMLREGKTKVVGKITRLFDDLKVLQEQASSRPTVEVADVGADKPDD